MGQLARDDTRFGIWLQFLGVQTYHADIVAPETLQAIACEIEVFALNSIASEIPLKSTDGIEVLPFPEANR